MDSQEEILGLNTGRNVKNVLEIFFATVLAMPDDAFEEGKMLPAETSKVFEPLANALYQKLSEQGNSLTDLEEAIKLLGVFENNTIRRCANFLGLSVEYVNEKTYGYARPYSQMPISHWENKKQEFAKQDAQNNQPQS